jgi:hypothetical protein
MGMTDVSIFTLLHMLNNKNEMCYANIYIYMQEPNNL